MVSGLSHVWDVKRIGPGRWLLTERSGALWLKEKGRSKVRVTFPSERVWASGETGLMSLETSRKGRFWTCQGWETTSGSHDIRVVRWRLDGTRAVRKAVVVKGLPTSSGRHGGCRLLLARNGALHVGTGDAAVGSNPRDLTSLGGKVLRVDPMTGKPWKGNPWRGAKNRNKRLLLTYGHRNVQGLAQRGDGTVWSAEHGSYRDDEVNLLRKGGDYGWHPVPGYDESVPMTDHSLPGRQRSARWSSGEPTVATSGAVWVRGKKWGSLRGTLAVACLKDSRVMFLKFDERGRFQKRFAPAAFTGFGRIRSVTLTPDRDLLITTDNGSGDRVVRLSPR
jgi:glucose/arabinose dehydrogenase